MALWRRIDHGSVLGALHDHLAGAWRIALTAVRCRSSGGGAAPMAGLRGRLPTRAEVAQENMRTCRVQMAS